VAEDDWDLWAPFLGLRPADRRAQHLRRHVREDARRGQRHPPRRADALSRDEIVRAAIAIADAEGPDAISMRRIARELRAGTMSLYWHITSKEELLDLMIDTVNGGAQAPEPSGDWRADMTTMASNIRSALHRHRWMMDFLGGRPPLGPKSLENLERAMTSFDGLGLDKAEAITIVMSVATYVMGAVLREVQESNREAFQQGQFSSLPDAEREKIMRDFTARLRASGRYPHIVQLIEAGVDPDAADTRDARFEYGLECLLDGIATRLPGAAPPR